MHIYYWRSSDDTQIYDISLVIDKNRTINCFNLE